MTTSPLPADGSWTVHGLGLTVLDQQMFLREYPPVDAKVFAEGSRTQVGGPVPTALAQLRRFGTQCRLLGTWGEDPAGREIESDLSQTGIDFDPATCRSAGGSGVAHVWIESSTGRRTVASLRPEREPEVAAGGAFGRSARVLHLDGWGGDAAFAAAAAANEQGAVVILDSGSMKPSTARLLPLVAVLNTPLRFLLEFCGTANPRDGARRVLDLGPRLVTVTDGERGAGVYTAAVAEWLPAFPVRAVDTCGAGDVFCGGLVYAVLAGAEPLEALRFAMATAALKVTRLGNREALPTRSEVESFLGSRDGSGT